MSNDCCDKDECIIPGDDPWDCGCYSHDSPDGKNHSKNPLYRGYTDEQIVEAINDSIERLRGGWRLSS
jgi:hypothetical protein